MRTSRGEVGFLSVPGWLTRLTPRDRESLFCWAALALYVTSIVNGAVHHEMWRDEVRALSAAIHGANLGEMFAGIRDQGHPLLWYLILRLGHWVTKSHLVLPIASLAVAVAGACLFLWKSPFPREWRLLYLFGVLPLVEYSVVCRNYGLGVLVLFWTAATYGDRFQRPWLHGAKLLLLANTSAHAAIFAGALSVAWVVEGWLNPPAGVRVNRWAVAGGLLVALAGIALCAVTTMPTPEMRESGIRRASVATLAQAAAVAVLRPAGTMSELASGGLPGAVIGLDGYTAMAVFEVVSTVLILLAVLRFRRNRDLLVALILSVVTLGLFFQVVYVGYVRHIGLLLVMILCLEWIARLRDSDRPPLRGRRAFEVVLVTVLATHTVQGFLALERDIDVPMSASKKFGAFILRHPEYRNAILLGMPDYNMESLPYYVDNRWYSAEEGRFLRSARFRKGVRDTLTLGNLIDIGVDLNRRYGAPVLLAIGFNRRVFKDSAGVVTYRFGSVFTWTPGDRRRYDQVARRVAVYPRADRDETYLVRVIDAASQASSPESPAGFAATP